jgi:SNF2 family DNA or RNA helicase
LLPYFPRRVGLTGTPAPNGLLDLFGQYLCIDLGRSFGLGYTAYKEQYFLPQFDGSRWKPRKGAREEIYDRIKDSTISMSKDEFLNLSPVIEVDHRISLPKNLEPKYKELERELFVELDSGEEIEAFNQSALSMKCLQFCNGAVYTEDVGAIDRSWSLIHNLKIQALAELVEATTQGGVLVSYQFKHDAARIKQHFPDAVQIQYGDAEGIIDRWNRGEIRILYGHPRSIGHGLNLQRGGNHIVFFGVTWDLELYQQIVGRLDRPGQTMPVIASRIVIENTIEDRVLSAISVKTKTQAALAYAIREYRRERG